MHHNILQKSETVKVRLSVYKALFVLKTLINSQCSAEEILLAAQKDKYIQGSLNIDILRLIINALRNIGCEISKNDKSEYIMIKHPFGFCPNEKYIKLLYEIEKYFLDKNDWKTVCNIDDLFEHFSTQIEKNGQISYFRNMKSPFVKIRKNVLNILRTKEITGKELLFFYRSSKTEAGLRHLFVNSLYCDRGRIYLKGRDFDKKRFSVFNAEKIERIDAIKDGDFNDRENSYFAEYKLKGISRKTFEPENNETVIDENENEIIVRAKIDNEFKFFQKLILFGTDFVLLSPEDARMRFINKLNKVIEKYR